MTMLKAIAEDRLASEEPPGKPGWQPPVPAPFMQKAGVVGGVTIILNIVSLVFAVGMITVLFFISQSVREVAALEDRLSGLTQFEKRLSGQVDTVNKGVHGQFDEVNRRLSAMTDQLSRAQAEIEALTRRNREIAARLESLEPVFSGAVAASPEELHQPEGREVSLSAPPPAKKASPAEAPPPQSRVQFERIEMPDGKVTYSKVK
jgi:uncharacterized protein YoxC